MSVCCSDLDRARILAVSAPHSGDWLHATSSANCGLFLENEELRVAVYVRIVATVCVPHDCSCGTRVDAQGLHGFSCKKGAGKHIRHSLLNPRTAKLFQLTFAAKGGVVATPLPLDFGLPDRISS